MNEAAQKLITAFENIRSDDDLPVLYRQFSLVAADPSTHPHCQITGIYEGVVDGLSVKLTHRWHDPSRPFSIRPDVNKLKLEIQGMPAVLVEFEDRL